MDRYKRNILSESIGLQGQKKLQKAKVLILGAGGVGSFVLMNLAALGVGNIGLVDNDVVDITNLNRQVIYNTQQVGKYKVDMAKIWMDKFNPDINFVPYKIRLNSENFQDILVNYDILIDAFDTAESVLLLNECAIKMNKILVTAGSKDTGGLVMTIIPSKTPCVVCYITPEKLTELNKQGPVGVIVPTVSLVGAMQALETVKIILNKDYLLTSSPLMMDAQVARFVRPKIIKSKTEKCPVCGLPLHYFYNPESEKIALSS